MTKTNRRALVALDLGSWGVPWWKDREFFLRELALRGWDVLWTQGPRNLWHRHLGDWNKLPVKGHFEEVEVAPGAHITVDKAGRFAPIWPGHPLWNKLAARLWATRIRRWLRQRGHTSWGALVCDPSFDYLLPALRPAWHTFHIYDDLSRNTGWLENDRDAAARIARTASLITSVSDTMLGVLPEDQRPRAKILPHACDIGDFLPPPGGFPEPPELAAIPHPRIGYFGRISRKNDLPLIEQLIRATPEYQWVFVGSVREGAHVGFREGRPEAEHWRRILGSPNVHHFDTRPRAELPRWLDHMDVNAMFYRLDEEGYWFGGFPLKLFEYLACGRPVVASRINSIIPYGNVVRTASTFDEWLGELSVAVTQGEDGARDSLRRVAADNTWQSRGKKLDEWLTDISAT